MTPDIAASGGPGGQATHVDGSLVVVLQQIGTDVAAMRVEVGQIGTQLAVQEQQVRTADERGRDLEARVRVIESRPPVADHEGRIRALERFRYTLAGVAAVGGVLAGLVGQWIAQHVH